MGTVSTLAALKARYQDQHAQAPHLPAESLPGTRGEERTWARQPKPTPEPAAHGSRRAKLSLRDILLAAARTFAEPFTLADLTLAAWRAHPQRFGLPGYETEYPDHHVSFGVIYGARGLLRTGHLVRERDGRFRVGRDS